MTGPRRMTSRASRMLGVIVVLAATSAGGVVARVSPADAAVDPGAAQAAACPEVTASAATMRGTGPFAELEVTVGQTASLLNQVVTICWQHGTPTDPVANAGRFQRNFLQIMQCWGDDADSPRREQCQYGGLSPDTARGGVYVNGRQVVAANLVDPDETYQPKPGGDRAWVPFESVTNVTLVDGKVNELFDANTTNQVTFGRTRVDGGGLEYFEIQTGREAPGLGCGEALRGGGGLTGRSCWLVIVPRSDQEVDGSVVSGQGTLTTDRTSYLQSSPLSMANWKHRIVFPLSFQPQGTLCSIGAAERPTLGNEMITEAITRWQPGLCATTGTVYSFGQVSDDLARVDMQDKDPALAFVTRPLPPDATAGKGPPVYAPAALSGLAIAFNVDSQSLDDAPEAVRMRNGQRIPELNLTPRVVAKLLTQSYRAATNDPATIPDNPLFMDKDPDFLADNPAFQNLTLNFGIKNVLSPLGSADAYAQLWEWIAGDAEARDFLDGEPDPWGAVVNPNYQDLATPRPDLPKSDLACQTFPDDGSGLPPPGPLCPADNFPSTNDMHEAVRATSRGDWLVKAEWDPGADPPAYKKSGLQASGVRALLALSDTATAARFSLPTARLRNAAGKFVAPTAPSLLAGVAAAKPSSVPGIVEPNPRAPGADVYPLTAVTHAAAVPGAWKPDGRRDYAALLRYVAGPGQRPGLAPGSLPPGYVPLPSSLLTQLRDAATAIEKWRPPAAGPSGGGSGGAYSGGAGVPAAGLSGASPAGGADGTGAGPAGGGQPSAATPGAAPAAVRSGAQLPPGAPAAEPTRKTPKLPVGAVRYALLGVLAACGVAAVASAALRFAARSRPRKEVMPTPDHAAAPSL
jgi:hypothetical protein